MLQIHIDKAVRSIIPPIVITISTYGEKYAGYDLRQPAKINCEIFRSASDRQYFSANVQHLRHHHCRPSDRHSGAGGRRRFGTVVFYAGFSQHRFHQRSDRHCRPAVRRPRLPGPAPFRHHRHRPKFRFYTERQRNHAAFTRSPVSDYERAARDYPRRQRLHQHHFLRRHHDRVF